MQMQGDLSIADLCRVSNIAKSYTGTAIASGIKPDILEAAVLSAVTTELCWAKPIPEARIKLVQVCTHHSCPGMVGMHPRPN